MATIDVGTLRIEATETGIAILDQARPDSAIRIPKDAVQDVLEFLTYHSKPAESKDRRRSFRIALSPGDLLASLVTNNQLTELLTVDISLGGMLVEVKSKTKLAAGDLCAVRLQLDDMRADLNCDVVRLIRNQIALRFIDCEQAGEIVPTPELALICGELQRRWLEKRIKAAV